MNAPQPVAMGELEPCPCCLRRVYLETAVRAVGVRVTDAEIIAAWNTRATSHATTKLAEVEGLVGKWRADAKEQTDIGAHFAGLCIETCADELAAAIAQGETP